MENILRGLNVYLIGMMGSGKTTVGKLLAEKLQYRFLDTDSIIETVSQKTINEIFALEGEEGFRRLESNVLQQVSPYIRTVIATGGGIILRQENWGYLREGMVIWLDTPVEVLVKRLTDDHTRPLLQNQDLMVKLTNLKQQREFLYRQADITISFTENDTPSDIVEKLLTEIPFHLKAEFNPDLN
ncbi:MAG: shikimate kinase [Cyanobacteria bacterium]|nr:shikimate kinase [Cyanobacteria bacterium CG_2015-16_32_12]NCO76937.1 shikimate kinase [Cyanobacteria bacterium CG_2015-22_32_23]NCQ05852.1 shikimate kinase [Cyanobacteria bacterium CG_2015-09_32_10]NCQ42924.1 shikimate kinase [Cyanobacteria bacterium CG_2015-04_32_10]